MIQIPLTRGKVAVIDDEDRELVAPHKWYATLLRDAKHERWYACTAGTTYMHRLIMGDPRDESGRAIQVDHVSGDGLDNRRANLRRATPSEQARNSRDKQKRAEVSSQYKGVSWHTTRTGGCWRAEIELPGRKRIIKYASTEYGAALLYNQLATEHFGEHARLNEL